MLRLAMIGQALSAHNAVVECGRLRFFAKATGETNPIYSDEAAAKDAGHLSLPVPPTFLFCLAMDVPAPFDWFSQVGLDLSRILHGEQNFTYHAMAYAGDTLRFESRVADMYTKKGGTLEFVVRETRVTNLQGKHVADLRDVIVQR